MSQRIVLGIVQQQALPLDPAFARILAEMRQRRTFGEMSMDILLLIPQSWRKRMIDEGKSPGICRAARYLHIGGDTEGDGPLLYVTEQCPEEMALLLQLALHFLPAEIPCLTLVGKLWGAPRDAADVAAQSFFLVASRTQCAGYAIGSLLQQIEEALSAAPDSAVVYDAYPPSAPVSEILPLRPELQGLMSGLLRECFAAVRLFHDRFPSVSDPRIWATADLLRVCLGLGEYPLGETGKDLSLYLRQIRTLQEEPPAYSASTYAQAMPPLRERLVAAGYTNLPSLPEWMSRYNAPAERKEDAS